MSNAQGSMAAANKVILNRSTSCMKKNLPPKIQELLTKGKEPQSIRQDKSLVQVEGKVKPVTRPK